MKTPEYLAALKTLDLTKVGAAPCLGISRRQAQRFAAGDPVSTPVAKLLRVMLKHKIPAEEVAGY